MLFDSELAIFNHASLDDTSLSNRGAPLFSEIREKYQQYGTTLAEKAVDWLKEVQNGQLNEVLKRVEELGQTFEEQFQVHGRLVVEKMNELHQREVDYRDTEEKLI